MDLTPSWQYLPEIEAGTFYILTVDGGDCEVQEFRNDDFYPSLTLSDGVKSNPYAFMSHKVQVKGVGKIQATKTNRTP